MAKKSGGEQSSDDLKVAVARSRDRLERDLRSVRTELDFPRKIKRSFRENTIAWIGAAVAVGTLVVLAATRTKKVYVSGNRKISSQGKLLEAGFLLGLAKVAVTLVRPAVTKFLEEKMRVYASERRFSGR
jgi:hypothetical protein